MEGDCRKSTEEECAKAPIKLEPGSTEEKGANMQGHPGRRSSGKTALTFELVSRHFCVPINQAARELNVGLTVLKRRCRELGIPRWPHRKVKSLQVLIDAVQVEELGKETEQVDGHRTRAAVEMLQRTKKLIEEKPDQMLDQNTRQLRQACFKRQRLSCHNAVDGLGEGSVCGD